MDLNIPEYNFRIRKNVNGKHEIFDEYRRKYIIITPEEWVRQNFLRFLKEERRYPAGLISVEKGISVNNLKKRFDAVVYNKSGKPNVLIEFKAPEVRIDQKVMEQISAYNLNLHVKYLIVSNGVVHYCCKIDFSSGQISFLNNIPYFDELI
jgi:hypothetical protein